MEEAVESRIIEQHGDTWALHHGPFVATDFQRDTPWTLLVQAVDHYVPEVAQLRKLFSALPNWRLDDIMVSYATDGGGVGPHFDNYDVFLLQGEGRRRWQLGQQCNDATPHMSGQPLRILSHFKCSADYVLETGDMLYVPPGVAHWGIAEDACTTFSIGFRAPRIGELLARWTDFQLEQLSAESFFSDPGRQVVSRAGELTAADAALAREQVLGALQSGDNNWWLGELITEPREAEAESGLYPVNTPNTEATETATNGRELLQQRFANRVKLRENARLAWMENSSNITVFANGRSHIFPARVLTTIITLCANNELDSERLAHALACDDCNRCLKILFEQECIDVE